MWIFTVDGFYSAVETPWDQELLTVRGRERKDMVKLCSRLRYDVRNIDVTPKRDYPYRIYISKKRWSSYVAYMAANIDYGNFKERALQGASPEKRDKYHDVWSVMAGYYQGY